MKLTEEQLAEIQHYLDQGLTPEEVADTIARVSDIEDRGVIVTIRSAAYALSRGETP